MGGADPPSSVVRPLSSEWWAGTESNRHRHMRGVYSALGSPMPSLPGSGIREQ